MFHGLFFDFYAYLALEGVLPFHEMFTTFKDVVFIIVLLVFVLRFLMVPQNIRIPNMIVLSYAIFFMYMISSLSKSYGDIGLLGSALSIRNTFAYVPVLFMTLYAFREKKDIEAIANLIVYITIVINIYAILQFIFRYVSPYLIITGNEWKAEHGYINSSFISYIELSLFCNLAIFLLLSIRKYLVKKYLVLFAVITSGIAILIIQSRTGIIVLMMILVISSVRYKIIKFRYIAATASLLILCLLLLPVISHLESHRLLQSNIFEDVRFISVWAQLIPVSLDRIIFGHGMGYYGPSATKAAELGNFSIETSYVDSSLISLFLNGGIIGLGLFLIFIFIVFRYLKKITKICQDPFLKNLLKGIRLSILIIVIYSVVFNCIDGFPGAIYFWFLLGIGITIAQINKREQNEKYCYSK